MKDTKLTTSQEPNGKFREQVNAIETVVQSPATSVGEVMGMMGEQLDEYDEK